jgi:hypothetical protein
MFHRYDYEAEFYPSLNRLPLDVRRKLDVTGIKISLKDWLAFSMEERMALCHMPCDNEEERQVFSSFVDFLARRYFSKPTQKIAPLENTAWSELAVPDAVAQKSAALSHVVSASEWRRFPAHHRYALYKSAVSDNQPEAFEKVLIQLRKLTPRD